MAVKLIVYDIEMLRKIYGLYGLSFYVSTNFFVCPFRILKGNSQLARSGMNFVSVYFGKLALSVNGDIFRFITIDKIIVIKL